MLSNQQNAGKDMQIPLEFVLDRLSKQISEYVLTITTLQCANTMLQNELESTRQQLKLSEVLAADGSASKKSVEFNNKTSV